MSKTSTTRSAVAVRVVPNASKFEACIVSECRAEVS